MSYLDVELLTSLVKRCTDVHFHFVGGFKESGRLRILAGQLPNVLWWGKVESDLIPSILEHADVLLVAYQASRYLDQASPHKLMEYLASGKVIVATYTDEYRDRRQLLEMVDDPSEFVATFERVAANLAEYNSPSRQAERKAFACEHTYDRQVERIRSLLRTYNLISD